MAAATGPTIPLNQVTAAEAAARAKALAAQNAAYTKAIAQRRAMADYVKRSLALAHGGPSQHIVDSRNKYQQAVANEKQARARRDAYQTGQYAPFQAEYKRLNALDASNTGGLDALLAKLTPYDPQAAAEKMTAQRSLDDVLSQLTTQKQNLAEDYATNSRTLDTQQPNDNRSVLSNYSGRGMAYSSGYGTAVGNLSDAYANQRSALSTALNRGNAQATAQEASARSNYLDAIGTILANTTSNLTSSAGQLGLAGGDVPYLVELARRRLAAGSGG